MGCEQRCAQRQVEAETRRAVQLAERCQLSADSIRRL
jgi:hypothetical protein